MNTKIGSHFHFTVIADYVTCIWFVALCYLRIVASLSGPTPIVFTGAPVDSSIIFT
jgi:hypothetical protein